MDLLFLKEVIFFEVIGFPVYHGKCCNDSQKSALGSSPMFKSVEAVP